MATASQESALDTVTEKAQNAARLGAHALRTAAAYSRPSAVSVDVALEAIENDRRRGIIEALDTRFGGQSTLSDLCEYIAADEYDTTVEGLTSQQRKRVYVSLYQTHMPKLDELGLVDYDKTGGSVVAAPELRDVAEWLDDTTLRFEGGDA